MGHDADAGQRPIKARARPVASPNGLIDPRGEQQLGRDLPPALGQPDLIARHARTAPAVVMLLAHPLWVDGVAQAVRPFQVMHHPIAARPVVVVAHRRPVAADARRDDVDVILGVPHHDIGRVREAHAPQVVAAERGPLLLGQPLACGQAQRTVVDRPALLHVARAHRAELGRQRARRRPVEQVARDDPRLVVAQFDALLEDVVEHAPEAATDLLLLNHPSPLPLYPSSSSAPPRMSAARSARTSAAMSSSASASRAVPVASSRPPPFRCAVS
jgi:hypothetical protein